MSCSFVGGGGEVRFSFDLDLNTSNGRHVGSDSRPAFALEKNSGMLLPSPAFGSIPYQLPGI